MRGAFWSPMMEPPLPCRNDPLLNTCEHAYPDEECVGDGLHLTLDQQKMARRYRQRDVAVAM